MSNEPGGPAPLPDPYTVPGGHESDRGPVPPPSGYEAVVRPPAPYSAPAPVNVAPSWPAGPPAETTNPFSPPTASGAPVYASPPQAAYGPPPTGSPYGAYGQAPAYGAYGQAPAYGTPYGTPYDSSPYGPGYSLQPAPNEPLAIASMVTGLAGLVVLGGLPGPVALGLGIAALRRIRRNGTSGRGMAIAGVILGSVGIVYLLAVIGFIVALVNTSSYDDPYSYGSDDGSDQGGDEYTSDPLPDYTLRTDLQLGDCLDIYAYSYDMSDTSAVDCGVAHEGEIVSMSYLFEPTGTDLSAEDPVWTDAWDQCVDDAEMLLPEGYQDHGELVLFTPHPDDFDSPDGGTGYCTFFTYEEPMTGSAVQHTLTFSAGSLT